MLRLAGFAPPFDNTETLLIPYLTVIGTSLLTSSIKQT
jgi:hypothetical protein